jgi:hypothetical protein
MRKPGAKGKIVETISVSVVEHTNLMAASNELAAMRPAMKALEEMQKDGELVSFATEHVLQAAVRTLKTLREECHAVACPIIENQAAATAFATMWSRLDQIRSQRADLSPIQQRLIAFMEGANILIATSVAQARYDAVAAFGHRLASEREAVMAESNQVAMKTMDDAAKHRIMRDLLVKARAYEEAQVMLAELIGAGGVAQPAEARPPDAAVN